LGATVDHPGFLQRMQVSGGADAFDGEDLFPILELADRDHTGLDRFVVDEHGTGAALAVIAADFAAREQQLFAQYVGQFLGWIDDQGPIDTIDIDDDSFHDTLLELFK
jgi:hypothetical protein